MNFFVASALSAALICTAGLATAASNETLELRADAEYMMRKLAEDIHLQKYNTLVTDKTRDNSIKIEGYALKFKPVFLHQASGTKQSCSVVSLESEIVTDGGKSEKITRTAEICMEMNTGKVTSFD